VQATRAWQKAVLFKCENPILNSEGMSLRGLSKSSQIKELSISKNILLKSLKCGNKTESHVCSINRKESLLQIDIIITPSPSVQHTGLQREFHRPTAPIKGTECRGN
jgi:hypothetical protein